MIWCITNRFVKVGNGSIIYPTTSISAISDIKKRGGVIIGQNCAIGRRKSGRIIGHFYPTKIYINDRTANIIIGNNVNLNGAYIASRQLVSIGDNCRIAAGVVIIDYNGHIVNSINRTIGQDSPQSIIIGNNVWIATNSIILKGTHIGDNCVVAAGSIVKGNFECNSIIQGNPGVVVGKVKI